MTRLAPTQVELEIPITPQELAAAEDRAFRKLVRNVRLPGFRAGKVPRRVFEQTYGTESISSQAMEEVVPEIYTKAIREHDLDPVDRPKMELLPEEDGKPARLKAIVEVRPEIALGSYKGIEIAREPVSVSQEDVDRSIAALAKERATLVPVERAAQLGDVVTIDYEGKVDDVAFEGGTASGQVTELDGTRFIPGFVDGIIGMQAGQTRDVEAHFPADYSQSDLAGKAAVFTVTLHDVKTYELPMLDDEFAKSISQNGTFEELREDVRKRLEAVSAARARRAVGNGVMERLIETRDFPLPESLVEREIDHMVSETESQAERAGISFTDYLEREGKTADELRSEYRNDAQMRVKGTLLIEAVAKNENIVATPADVAEELAALGRQYGQPVENIRKSLGKNVVSLMDGIVRNKTLEFLIDNAKVVDKI